MGSAAFSIKWKNDGEERIIQAAAPASIPSMAQDVRAQVNSDQREVSGLIIMSTEKPPQIYEEKEENSTMKSWQDLEKSIEGTSFVESHCAEDMMKNFEVLLLPFHSLDSSTRTVRDLRLSPITSGFIFRETLKRHYIVERQLEAIQLEAMTEAIIDYIENSETSLVTANALRYTLLSLCRHIEENQEQYLAR